MGKARDTGRVRQQQRLWRQTWLELSKLKSSDVEGVTNVADKKRGAAGDESKGKDKNLSRGGKMDDGVGTSREAGYEGFQVSGFHSN